jgi:hypothetical protein
VDLAVVSVTELYRISPLGVKEYPFYVSLDRKIIPSADVWADFDAIEDVTMVGCPNGLFDASNNLPMFRKGITASHPAKNYQGRSEFVVDLACFPGSSGSPVFLYSTGANFDRSSGNYSLGNIRMFLLGVLYAGPTINQQGRIVLSKDPSVSISAMMHLGMVVKSTRILDFEDMVRKQESGL